jgi:hypothetical protein
MGSPQHCCVGTCLFLLDFEIGTRRVHIEEWRVVHGIGLGGGESSVCVRRPPLPTSSRKGNRPTSHTPPFPTAAQLPPQAPQAFYSVTGSSTTRRQAVGCVRGRGRRRQSPYCSGGSAQRAFCLVLFPRGCRPIDRLGGWAFLDSLSLQRATWLDTRGR